VLARDVVQHQIHEHADPAPVRLGDQSLEVVVGAVIGVDAIVVRDVVAVITRRLGHRHQPDAAGAEVAHVIELLDEAVHVPDAVTVAVVERADEDLVAHGARGDAAGGDAGAEQSRGERRDGDQSRYPRFMRERPEAA